MPLNWSGPTSSTADDRTTTIDGVPDGYRAMNDREAIKVMIES